MNPRNRGVRRSRSKFVSVRVTSTRAGNILSVFTATGGAVETSNLIETGGALGGGGLLLGVTRHVVDNELSGTVIGSNVHGEELVGETEFQGTASVVVQRATIRNVVSKVNRLVLAVDGSGFRSGETLHTLVGGREVEVVDTVREETARLGRNVSTKVSRQRKRAKSLGVAIVSRKVQGNRVHPLAIDTTTRTNKDLSTTSLEDLLGTLQLVTKRIKLTTTLSGHEVVSRLTLTQVNTVSTIIVLASLPVSVVGKGKIHVVTNVSKLQASTQEGTLIDVVGRGLDSVVPGL